MTLLELLGLLKKNLKLVVILPLVCAIGMGAYAFMGMEDEYTATASMYVLAKQDEIGDNLNTNLSASQMVANDVATLLKSDRVRDLAARDLGVKSLAGFDISVTSETTSRVLSVTVTGDDPKQVAELANSLAQNVSASLRTSCRSRPSTSSTAQTPPRPPAVPRACCISLSRSSLVCSWPLRSSWSLTCSTPRSAPQMRSRSFWASPLSAAYPP